RGLEGALVGEHLAHLVVEADAGDRGAQVVDRRYDRVLRRLQLGGGGAVGGDAADEIAVERIGATGRGAALRGGEGVGPVQPPAGQRRGGELRGVGQGDGDAGSAGSAEQ